MKNLLQAGVKIGALFFLAGSAAAQAPSGMGSQEFGMSPRQLVQAIEKVEAEIANCMRDQGFRYVAVDYITVRKGMGADKVMAGLSEEEFIDKYGFGVSTMYTGKPPQLADGYSPGRDGLGPQNVAIFKNLSPADRIAYNRALFGANPDATFAIGLETENFSRTGGCTRKGIEAAFSEEQLKASYYNPKDALINKDHRMIGALRVYAMEMRRAGFEYNHPDEVEPDVRARLAALVGENQIPIEQLSPEQRAALAELQDYERRVAAKNFQLQEEIFDPVEAKIEKEMFARQVR